MPRFLATTAALALLAGAFAAAPPAHAQQFNDAQKSEIGTIVREIRFQSSFSEIGITGWMFRRLTEPSSSGP